MQAAGLSGAFGSCAAGVLTSITPETPAPPQKSQGAEESPYSLPLTPNVSRGNSAGKESIVWLVAPAYTALLWRAGCGVGWVAAVRSRVWPKAPFPGGGPEVGWGLVKETAPFPCTNGAGAIVVELVALGAQLGGQCPQGLSWVLEVKIQARRLYEARLLGGEGGPVRWYSWGQWTPERSPWWPGYPTLVLETPEH